jgi:CRP/FNR family transcriptional regulator, cyclic AMP receptor protein
VDPQVRLALSRSHLRELPGDVLDELMVGASRVQIPAGSVTHWEEVTERVLSFVWEISSSAFATVRQRLARHLLDLASERMPEPGSELVVTVTQRELAEAVGTAREVVVRVMRELRQEGVVRTGRDRIVIADPARLIQEYGWNPGS